MTDLQCKASDKFEDLGNTEEAGDDEDDEEPWFKYKRMGYSVSDIFVREAATCMVAHEKFLVMGTNLGKIHIIDYNGTETESYQYHSDSINDISIDLNGEYIASCSKDNSVAIHNLFGSQFLKSSFNQPLSISIDPNFSKSERKEYIVGGRDEKLVFVTRGWFGIKDIVLSEKEGVIYLIRWNGIFIAWVYDYGIKIYDINTRELIAKIHRPEVSPQLSSYVPLLLWESTSSLIISWVNCVQVVNIKTRPVVFENSKIRFVEIVSMFVTEDFYISGLAPYKDYIVILAYYENKSTGDVALPEIHIVSRDGKLVTSPDQLALKDYNCCKVNDYRLCSIIPTHDIDDWRFWVVSPRDIVTIRLRDLDDRISWLLDHKMYKDALHVAKLNQSNNLKKYSLTEIGQKYLNYLFDKNQLEKAASECPSILGTESTLWQDWILKFERSGKINVIASYIPTENPKLNNVLYEMILNDFLQHDPQGFLDLIEKWPPDIYKLENIIVATKERIKTTDPDAHNTLYRALTKLYLHFNKLDDALDLYIKLNEDIFELVTKYGSNNFTTLKSKILPIVKSNPEKAIPMLIANLDTINVHLVVKQLYPDKPLLLKYLHALFEAGKPDRQYNDLQIELYSVYDLKNLENFLTKVQSYNYEKALEICEKKGLYKNMVLINDKTGNTKEALNILIENIGDVRQTIEYVQKKGENDLWDELIDRSVKLDNPMFISGLLEDAGTHINPLTLIRKIPMGMNIPHLRDRLVKILNDYNLQISLKEGYKDILNADCNSLVEKLSKGIRNGIFVNKNALCFICSKQVFYNITEPRTAFFCGHIFHRECLIPQKNSGSNIIKKNSIFRQEGLLCPKCNQKNVNSYSNFKN